MAAAPRPPPRPRPLVVVVAATERSHAIGRAGTLPWRLRGDMALFASLTRSLPPLWPPPPPSSFAPEHPAAAIPASPVVSAAPRNAVVMGRLTWDSIPARARPLAGRLSVIISSTPGLVAGAIDGDEAVAVSFDSPASVKTYTAEAVAFSSFGAALAWLDSAPLDIIANIFVGGGARIYANALSTRGRSCLLFLTAVSASLDVEKTCDVHFPLRDLEQEGFQRQDSSVYLHVVGDSAAKTVLGACRMSDPKDIISRDTPLRSVEGDLSYEFQLWKRDALISHSDQI
ncbi:dihydrofolate reductase [Cladochytrium tenue]|nr:dihydrofolate reductase [Cladochytrium tenue]